jgi:hypothetical protein
MLDCPFIGFVVVVNNTYRGLKIPVAQVVQDIWNTLGYEASIKEENEQFHVGTKNPRAKGVRAKHIEYIVQVEKR